MKAISDCGWNMLNRFILTNEDICATMTENERATKNDPSTKIMLPNKNDEDNSSSKET